jgi:DNA repair exonuclease SbcCD ATPase subunit
MNKLIVKMSHIYKEKEDFEKKLNFFINPTERKKKKKNFDDSFEELLSEQFENMKNGFLKELEEKQKEITNLISENRKKNSKYEDEIKDIKHRYKLCSTQLEEIKIICQSILS